jgi:PAS domain S-box-containing protein
MNSALEHELCNWLMSDSADPLIVTDSSGTIIQSNLAAQALFGYSEWEFREIPLERLIPERYRASHQKWVCGYLHKPTSRRMGDGRELYGLRQDGSEFAAEISLSPLGNGLVLANVQDITDRKKVAQALAEREVQFRAATETVADGFWMIDMDGVILAVNDAYARRSGYSREELLNMNIADLEAQETPDQVRAHIKKILSKGKDCFETMHRTKSGEIWPVEVNAAYWHEAGRFFVFARDITERKQAFLALEECEARFRATFEQAAVGIAHTSTDGHWLRVNDKFCEIVGYSHDELLQRTFQDITYPDDRTADLNAMHQLLVGKIQAYRVEKRYVRKSGEIVWARLTVNLVPQQDNEPAYFLAVVENISKRKKAEVALQALNAELEELSRYHVAHQTISAIAHDLNQPLNAVASYSEAALRLLQAGNPQPDKLLHALESSARQASRAGQVVRELVEFLGSNDVQTEPVDLNDAVQRILARIQANSHKGIQVKLELESNLPLVMANRVQIEKVLTNLIANGVDAMQEAGLSQLAITVSLNTHTDGNMARVTVQDSGPGMDEKILHNIFDPFFTTKPKGLGMGLAICRSIIEAHGGQLWAESKPGQGASFHFTLPFAT